MACDTAELLSTASCFQCLTAGEQQLIRLSLFCRIANGVTMACDIATLLSEASCFQCLPPGQLTLLEIALLCTIMTNGGGPGGSGGLSSGAADPVAAPTNPAVDNIYRNTVTNTAWWWPAGGAAWTQFV